LKENRQKVTTKLDHLKIPVVSLRLWRKRRNGKKFC